MAWKPIDDRKWELKCKGTTIATIYKKNSAKYSLFVASPMVYDRVANLLGKTYRFESLEEAQEACDAKLRKQVLPWCKAVVSYLEGHISENMNNYLALEFMIPQSSAGDADEMRSLMDSLWTKLTEEEHKQLDAREIPDSESK